MHETTASGRDAMLLAGSLLRRQRAADPLAGIWEAADVQWWSRKPRPSDEVDEVFWVDDQGPVAGVLLTCWDSDWQVDPIVVPGLGVDDEMVWDRAVELGALHGAGRFEVPVFGADEATRARAEAAGMVAGESSCSSWMDAADRPAVRTLPDGYTLVDRSVRVDRAHPMVPRNGAAIQERLLRCPLYDATLDLAIEAPDGSPAGYSLYWYDPVTHVGLVEPVRVEDDHQRRGLATTMITHGVDRLVARGARRIKIGYGSEAAGAAYTGLGFRTTSTDTWWVSSAQGG